MLKTLVIGAVVATLLGTAALAQSYDPDEGGGNINPPIASLQGGQAPTSAFAYVPDRMQSTRVTHSRMRRQIQQDQEQN